MKTNMILILSFVISNTISSFIQSRNHQKGRIHARKSYSRLSCYFMWDLVWFYVTIFMILCVHGFDKTTNNVTTTTRVEQEKYELNKVGFVTLDAWYVGRTSKGSNTIITSRNTNRNHLRTTYKPRIKYPSLYQYSRTRNTLLEPALNHDQTHSFKPEPQRSESPFHSLVHVPLSLRISFLVIEWRRKDVCRHFVN